MRVEPLVEIRNISMKYQSPEGEIPALKDISLDVREGEFVSIVGPSGCGKSTLLNIIARLILPSSGERQEYLQQRKNYRIKVICSQIFLLAALLVLWEIAANLRLIDPFITSQPSRVMRTLVSLHNEGGLYYHIGITVFETVVGFVLGTIRIYSS